jgi:uncharacterized protein (DUF1778 family)
MILVKNERFDQVITLRVPSEMKQRLFMAAHANNRTLTDFVLNHARLAADKVLAAEQRVAANG